MLHFSIHTFSLEITYLDKFSVLNTTTEKHINAFGHRALQIENTSDLSTNPEVQFDELFLQASKEFASGRDT